MEFLFLRNWMQFKREVKKIIDMALKILCRGQGNAAENNAGRCAGVFPVCVEGIRKPQRRWILSNLTRRHSQFQHAVHPRKTGSSISTRQRPTDTLYSRVLI